MSTAGYLGTLCLFLIPVVGLVLMFVFSFASDVKPERRKLARAYLIRTAILFAIGILVVILLAVGIFAFAANYGGYPFNYYY